MILDASDVTLPEMRVQAALRDAFAQLGTGRAVQPSQTLTEVPGGGDVIAYQALLAEAGVYAVKVSPYLPQPDGAAVVTAWTMLVSTRTGRPLLLTEASFRVGFVSPQGRPRRMPAAWRAAFATIALEGNP